MDRSRDAFAPALPACRGFLDALLKSFVILIVAGGVCLCWRRGAASARHLVWFLAVAGLLCLPGLSGLLPAWQRPLWAVGTRAGSGNEITLTLEFVPAKGNHSLPPPDACPFARRSGSRFWPCAGRRRATARDAFPRRLGSRGPGRLVGRGGGDSPFGCGRAPAAPGAPPRRATTFECGLARVIAPALRGIADWAARDFVAVRG